MRFLEKMCFIVLASGLALGQGTAQSSGSNSSGTVSDELKALREAISEQQKQISQQQQQIQTLQQQLQDKAKPQQQPVATVTPRSNDNSARVVDASLHTTPVAATTVTQETERPKESPLSFRIGNTDFTPGGFVDFENVFRTTNTGASITTPFGTIPFSNTVQGHLTEFRSTGQYSRYNLKISGKYGENRVTGYIEGDFNGNDAANVFVTSNPHTNRLRLYWMDLRRGNWEFLGGQTWGLQTPNRVGLSPNPADVFVTIGEDAQTHVGLPYTRAAEFRVNYHFSDHFQWAVAVQNPDQFIGAGLVTLPTAFNAQLTPQLDAANQTTTADLFPDLHTKMAWDTDAGGRHTHFELGGLMTSVKTTAIPVGGTTFQKHTSIGGGFEGAFNVELVKGFRFLANALYGDGVGRYLIGFAPQTVIVPIATGPGAFTIDNSLVHSGSGIIGSELTAGKSQFGFYYGAIYAQRNAFPDITSTAAVKPIIGFGGINSPNTDNRTIQEGTIDWTQTFWKNPQYGAVLLVTQTSYVTRAPWFVATGAPKNAHLMMAYVSLKYVLP